jgi:hypothetical protein
MLARMNRRTREMHYPPKLPGSSETYDVHAPRALNPSYTMYAGQKIAFGKIAHTYSQNEFACCQ